jgi:hypothetical protein
MDQRQGIARDDENHLVKYGKIFPGANEEKYEV